MTDLKTRPFIQHILLPPRGYSLQWPRFKALREREKAVYKRFKKGEPGMQCP